jgi:ribosomal protein L37AE/L43A
MKLLGGLAFLVLALVWEFKRRQGRKHLRALERGEACLSCQGTDVVRETSGVRCRTCGAFTNTAWLNESTVSTEEASAGRPDDFDV